MTIQRKRIEELLLSSLKERFLTAENLRYVFDNVEKEVAKTLGQVPEELKQKRHQYEKVQAELQNLLSFVKAGNFSRVVSEALTDAENRGDKLKGEMQGLEFQRTNAFKAPPKEWIEFRLEKLCETLNQNTKASALALKDLLGTIELEPVPAECVVENGRLIENRPYYLAHTNIDTLALLDKEYKGTNWSLLRTRSVRIRTISQIPVQIKIPCHQNLPVYQILASKIKELKTLGLSNEEIATRLKINKKTVGKGLTC